MIAATSTRSPAMTLAILAYTSVDATMLSLSGSAPVSRAQPESMSAEERSAAVSAGAVSFTKDLISAEEATVEHGSLNPRTTRYVLLRTIVKLRRRVPPQQAPGPLRQDAQSTRPHRSTHGCRHHRERARQSRASAAPR